MTDTIWPVPEAIGAQGVLRLVDANHPLAGWERVVAIVMQDAPVLLPPGAAMERGTPTEMGRRAFFLVLNDQEREVARLEHERNELRAAVSCEKQGRAEAEHALAKAEALIEKTARELAACLKDVKLLDARAAAATDKAHKLEVDLGKVRKAIGAIQFNEIVGE
jgi:hypothetical protein